MQHHFDTEIASEYGILEAVLMNHLVFWLRKNEAEGQGFKDGKYWSFFTIKAMKQLFPYVSETTLKRALTNLREKGLIEVDVHNTNKFDRTHWYTLTKLGLSKVQNQTFEETNLTSSEEAKLTPSEETKLTSCLNKDDENKLKDEKHKDNRFVDSDALNEAINLWLTYKKERRQTYTKTGTVALIKKVNAAVKKYGESYVIARIEDCIGNCYSGLWFDNGRKEKSKLDESKTDLDDIF